MVSRSYSSLPVTLTKPAAASLRLGGLRSQHGLVARFPAGSNNSDLIYFGHLSFVKQGRPFETEAEGSRVRARTEGGS